MTRPLQEGKSKFAYTIDFPSVVSFLIELYMSLCSVSLISESCIYGLGFDSQTLHGSLQLFQVIR